MAVAAMAAVDAAMPARVADAKRSQDFAKSAWVTRRFFCLKEVVRQRGKTETAKNQKKFLPPQERGASLKAVSPPMQTPVDLIRTLALFTTLAAEAQAEIKHGKWQDVPDESTATIFPFFAKRLNLESQAVTQPQTRPGFQTRKSDQSGKQE
jgi:hypothetical protein